MRTIRILPLIAVLLLTLACSTEQEQMVADDLVPVNLGYTLSAALETRAAAATATLNNSNIEAGGSVVVRIKNHDADASSYINHIYTTASGGVMTPPTPTPYYPTGTNTIDIVAYYPSSASSVFEISNSQTSSAAYASSDLMWADTDGDDNALTNLARTTATRTLKFQHRMAKIIVNATASDGAGTISSVKLKNIQPKVTFDADNGAVTTATTDSEHPVTDVAMLNEGAAVIPAQAIDGTFIEIVTTEGTAAYSLSTTLLTGHQYTFNITVNRTSIDANNTITDWDDSATAIVGQAGLTNALTIAAIEDQEYTGSAITGLSLSVSYNGNTIDPSDYDVYYVDNIEPGVATVAVEYNGLYSAREFNIVVPTNLSELKEWVTASKAYGKCLSYFVFNDGTISEADDGSAIGRIAYIGASDVDTSLGGIQNILVLQKSDEASSMAWYTSSYETSGVSKSTTDLSGYSNTSTLNSKYGSSYAGGRCWSKGLAVSTASQTQWFLASRGQWDLMKGADGMGLGDWERFLNLANITESGPSLYWSSSELNDNTAHHFIISDGSWRDDHRKNGTYRVRACFAF